MKLKYLTYYILTALFFLPSISLAGVDPLFDPITIKVNTTDCKMAPGSDLGVCILNKTGQALNSNEIFLGQSVSSPDGSFGSGSIIEYGIVDINKFLIIESTFARIKQGDMRNHIPYANVQYSLRNKWGKHFSGCEFKWELLIPPYNTPPVLIIEKETNGSDLICHFERL